MLQKTTRAFSFGKSTSGLGGGGGSWEQFKRHQGKFGKDRNDSYRAAYEKEKKERSELKLNWGIKNRWE